MAELINRAELEAKTGIVLARIGSRQRRELEAMLGNPPNLKNVPADWWDKSQQEIEDALTALLLKTFLLSAKQHGLKERDAIVQGEVFSAKYAKYLAKQFRLNTLDGLKSAAKEWGDQTAKSALLLTTLRWFGPSRFSTIAVNETTRAQHFGSELAIKTIYGLNPRDEWVTRSDSKVCEICGPLDGLPRSEWEQKFAEGPPEPHAQCRCWIRYASRR